MKKSIKRKLVVEFTLRDVSGKPCSANQYWVGNVSFEVDRGDLFVYLDSKRVAAFRSTSWTRVHLEELTNEEANQT